MRVVHFSLPPLPEPWRRWVLHDLWEVEGVLAIQEPHDPQRVTVVFEPPASEDVLQEVLQHALLTVQSLASNHEPRA